jgi:hypothetical protein
MSPEQFITARAAAARRRVLPRRPVAPGRTARSDRTDAHDRSCRGPRPGGSRVHPLGFDRHGAQRCRGLRRPGRRPPRRRHDLVRPERATPLFESTVGNDVGDMLMIASDQMDHASTRHRPQRFAPEVRTVGQFLQGHLVRGFAHASRVRPVRISWLVPGRRSAGTPAGPGLVARSSRAVR